MHAYIFPGQGSQSLGMGKDLFDHYPDLIATANKILGYSIKELCLEDPLHQLNKTQFTQPALYTVNALSFLQKVKETGVKPDFVAGHSLGEYAALFAAGVFDFATGLELVKKRGELMSEAQEGGMTAVIGLTTDEVQSILNKNNLQNINIANYNSYLQHVLSGSKQDITNARTFFSNSSHVNFIPLKVSGAFHSSYMLEAQEKFSEFLNSFTFSMPTTPVIANVDAQIYHPASIKINLANQISHSVYWKQSMQYLLSHSQIRIEEIGPGTVLQGILARMKNQQ